MSIAHGKFRTGVIAFLLAAGTAASVMAAGETQAAPAKSAAPQRPSKPATIPTKRQEPVRKAIPEKKSETPAKAEVKPEPVLENVIDVSPDELVSKPHEYVNKNVKFKGNFSGFSSLALDYKPAYRAAKTHLSFLIFRPNSHVPLSELKLAMMIPKEKDPDNALLATLKDGDELELVGKVFSAALDDPWVEVFKLKKLNVDKDKDKKAEADKDKDTTAKADESKPEDGKRTEAGKPTSEQKPTVDSQKIKVSPGGKPGIKVPGSKDTYHGIPADVVGPKGNIPKKPSTAKPSAPAKKN